MVGLGLTSGHVNYKGGLEFIGVSSIGGELL